MTSPTNSDFARLEDKLSKRVDQTEQQIAGRLDRLTDAVGRLVAMQSDLQHQERRIEMAEGRFDKLEALLDDSLRQRVEFDHLRAKVQALEAEAKDTASKLSQTREKLDGWINKVLGAALVIGAAWTVAQKFIH